MYSQLTDLQNVLRADALIELTDDENLGQINQDRVNEAIARGDSLIDSYCSSKFIVPFGAPVPATVRMLSEDLAIYHLYARRGEEIPGSVNDKFKNALKQLSNISKGLVNLGAPSASAVEDPEISISTPDPSTRTFTSDNTPGLNGSGSTLGGY